MNIDKLYLKFVGVDGELLVNVADILYSGWPIDSENGDDLDLYDNRFYNNRGEALVSCKWDNSAVLSREGLFEGN